MCFYVQESSSIMLTPITQDSKTAAATNSKITPILTDIFEAEQASAIGGIAYACENSL